MAIDPSVEQRLAAIEAAIADIQRHLGLRPPTDNWIQRIIGTGKDNPAFEKMVEYGREFRYADRPPDEPEESAP